MPKVKTHSGAKKRFSVTGSGKIKYMRTNKRHRLTQKDHKRKRLAKTNAYLSEANSSLRTLIPYK